MPLSVLIESDWNLKNCGTNNDDESNYGINRIRLEFKVSEMLDPRHHLRRINRIRLEFKVFQTKVGSSSMPAY